MEKKGLDFKEVGKLLEYYNVEFDNSFLASNTCMVGYWTMPDDSYLLCIIGYSDGEESSEYFIVDDSGIEDLASWLETPELSGTIEGIEEKANIRGAASIPDAQPDDVGKFYILRTRHWYRDQGDKVNSEASSIIAGDIDSPHALPHAFESYHEAMECVDRWYQKDYELHLDEVSRPTYKIIILKQKGE